MMKIETIHESADSNRILRISIKGKQLATPTYFPAVSGVEFGTKALDLISFVINSSYPRLLISAYDYSKNAASDKKRLIGEISNYVRNGSFLMLDSGVFESYWRGDNDWNFKNYQSVVPRIDCDFYFAFDLLPERFKASEPRYFKSVIEGARKSAAVKPNEICIPILHGTTPKKLLGLVKKIVKQYPDICHAIAVPERECGPSLSERAITISQIRQILNAAGLKQSLLHILGCGNPIAMATNVYRGADTFDSVDWNKQLIEPIDLRLYDIAQTEMLRCQCQVCEKMKDKPAVRALLHNLLFYQDFVLQLQRMVRANTLRDFLVQFLGVETLKKIESSAEI